MRAYLTGTAAATALLTSTAVFADAPQVITDIRPVHSIVSAVMGDLGAPVLLLENAADPHHFTLQPSQVRALAGADMVVWMGPELTPWLERGMDVATGAVSLPLLQVEGAPLLLTGGHAHHDHDEDDHAHDEEKHAEGDDHDHDHGHGDEDHAHDDHADGIDPHSWLDPMNAAAYAKAIGEALAAADPDNAATYMANAEAAGASYLALMPELATTMAPARGVTILPAHDAYRYFFTRFLIVASDGGITDMHDQAPSAARMSELRAQFEGVTPCVLTGPSVDPRLITAIFPDTTPIAADPLGLELEPGADLYPAVLQGMAASVGACAE